MGWISDEIATRASSCYDEASDEERGRYPEGDHHWWELGEHDLIHSQACAADALAERLFPSTAQGGSHQR